MSFFKKTATVAVASSLVFGAFGATAASALAPSPAAPAPQQANNDIEKLREQVKKAIADNKHLNDAQRQYLNSLVAAATTKVDLAGAAAVAAIYNPALFGTDFVAAFKKELLERDVPGVTKENKDRWGEIAQKVAELKTGAAPAETTKPADANKPAETTKPADKPAEGNKPAETTKPADQGGNKPAEKPADKPAEGNKPAASDLDNAREVAKVDLKNIKNLNDKQREVVHKYIDAAGSADLIRYAVGAARALAENAFPTAFLEYDKETVKNALPQASADEKAKLNKLAEDLIALADDSVRISNDIVVKADGTIFFNGVQITELAVPTNKPANLQVGGFKWGDEVKAQLDDKDYGSVPVYGDLAFLLSLTTRDLTPGDHKLVLSTGSKKTTLTLKVGATPTPVAPKTPENKPETKNPENTPNDKAEKNEKKDDKKLAKTGADSSALLVAAGILTAAGAASLLVARRRKA